MPTEAREPERPRLYRWTCPICGRSKSRFVAGSDDDRYVANDLDSHIRTTDGDGHGPSGSYPTDHPEVTLDGYIERHGG